jgi:excisionase family DNA binding protein
MKQHLIQLDVRENTASPRQRGSRFGIISVHDQSDNPNVSKHSASLTEGSSPEESATILPDNAEHTPATGRGDRHPNHLLTVPEVADLLQVPVSWVYGHIRRKCVDRIPGFRLGKYWRFCEQDVIAWLREKRTKN